MTDPRGAPALAFRDVSYRYPHAQGDALARASFDVSPGEVLAIVGRTGSGKSTLARLAAGLLRPDHGQVEVQGLDTSRATGAAMARRIGLVFQHPNHQLLASTVREELGLGPRHQRLAPAAVDARVASVAARLGLAAVLGRHPLRVPLPMRRHVAIGAVLAMQPEVLVLDEPTSGQGRRAAAVIEALIDEEARRGVAVVVVTHDLRFAAAVASRAIVLDGGRILADGPAPRLLADATLLATAGLEPAPLVRLAIGLGLNPDPDVPLTAASLEAAIRASRPESPESPA